MASPERQAIIFSVYEDPETGFNDLRILALEEDIRGSIAATAVLSTACESLL